MAEERKVDFLDYLIILLKKKKFFLFYFISIIIIAYGAIYFFVAEQYEATAVILSPDGDQLNSLSSLMKSFSGAPLSLSSINKKSTTDIYNTLIYSRTNLNNIITKFDLLKDYKEKSWEEGRKILSKKIFADENDNNAYTITVRANTPQKSAEIANFIVDALNKSLINLNIEKSRNNRIFLAERLFDIKNELRFSEDSLRKFEEKKGIVEIENQTKATVETYAKLESDLFTKEIESNILLKLYGESSPNVNSSRIAVEEFKNKIGKMKSGGNDNSLLLQPQDLPSEGMEYLRLLRNIKINDKLLEFIIPLFEQAKFDEQKETPIFQVIDFASPPEKRSYPHRAISAFIIGLIFLFPAFLFILFKEIISNSNNPKIIDLKKEFKLFKST
jgi:tyrosine-protein kinase Etk/Wzc